MRSVACRLARLERLNRLRSGPQRVRVQYLKRLPGGYTGPRHTVTVRQLPPVEAPFSREYDWFEWEESPGPEPMPVSKASRDNETIIQGRYVQTKLAWSA